MPLAKREQTRSTQHVASASKKSPTSLPLQHPIGVLKPPPHDPGLGIGVGAGALYMQIKRLKKTVGQTEHLVQEMRQQLHESLLSSSCSGSHSVHSAEITTVSSQGLENHIHQRNKPFGLTRSIDMGLCMEDQASTTRQVMTTDGSVENCQMAALEAELEAELELMEFNMNANSDQSMVHYDGESTSKGVQNSYYSGASSHGMLEISDLHRHSMHLKVAPIDYAVSPIELDYRLRQVLEEQQQERILELELLLKETEAKLLAKDQELVCWKNHANSLKNCFQPASVPEVAKNTLELLQSFQDPPISTQVNLVESMNSSFSSANLPKQGRNQSSSSLDVWSKNIFFLNEASDLSLPCFEGSLDFVKVVTESDTFQHLQGIGIDTPESIVLEEIDVHTPVQVKSEIFRGQSVSRVSEASDCTFHDEWSSDMLPPCHTSSCEHPDSLLSNVDIKESQSPPSRTKVFPRQSDPSPNLHHMKCKTNLKLPSLSSDPSRSKDAVERDYSDVKHIMGSSKLKQEFPHARNQGPDQEAVQTPRRSLNLKNESLQIVTRGLRRSLTFQENSMAVKSPVLDKIRHWEALGGHTGKEPS